MKSLGLFRRDSVKKMKSIYKGVQVLVKYEIGKPHMFFFIYLFNFLFLIVALSKVLVYFMETHWKDRNSFQGQGDKPIVRDSTQQLYLEHSSVS